MIILWWKKQLILNIIHNWKYFIFQNIYLSINKKTQYHAKYPAYCQVFFSAYSCCCNNIDIIPSHLQQKIPPTSGHHEKLSHQKWKLLSQNTISFLRSLHGQSFSSATSCFIMLVVVFLAWISSFSRLPLLLQLFFLHEIILLGFSVFRSRKKRQKIRKKM